MILIASAYSLFCSYYASILLFAFAFDSYYVKNYAGKIGASEYISDEE